MRTAFRSVSLAVAILAPATTGLPAAGPDSVLPADVDFDRHVAGLLGRLGCNAGACHGSFQGRGGLTLSLFGHDPEGDYRALTRDAMGRRVAPLEPDRSLVLLKPSGLVPHEGGRRFEPDSWEYRVIRSWIADGARRDPSRSPVERIEIRPDRVAFSRPGEESTVAVYVKFADGVEADLTAFCDLRVKDDAVAEVEPSGNLRALKAGDTAIIASYRGHLASARALVPTGLSVRVPDVPEEDFIDREVFAKLQSLGIEPSGPASDAEFLRRVTLDVIGTLPSPEKVRAFLADQAPDKREKTIDALLAHPMHAALWATRFLDITGCDVDAMEGPPEIRPGLARMWHDWFRHRVAANMPYDQIARGVLAATSRGGQEVGLWLESEATRRIAAREGRPTDYASAPGLDLFWRRYANNEYFPIEAMAERTATAFLGVRIECAQCHKHPFDRWTQADYRSYANLFSKVKLGHSPEGLAATAKLLQDRRDANPSGTLPPIPRLQEVFAADRPVRRLADPETGRPIAPRALGGPAIAIEGDPRQALVAWLTKPENPYFARSFVNRVWAAYFGAGLVDPVDGFSVANPPTNEKLLDALASDFASHGYDVRRLERLILMSRAYGRSSQATAGNHDSRGNFARSEPRMMMAEVLVDALNEAIGPDGKPGERAIEIATNRVESEDLARVLRVFGRPQRTATCDCERPRAPAVPRSLYLMADPALLKRIASGRVRRLIDSEGDNAAIVEEMFLATLSRFPSTEESESARDHLHTRPDRGAALADVLWALLNTREFSVIH